MNILLLGEFSALHKNLKEGLQELGHKAVIASSGDGWKNVPRDIDLNYQARSILGKARRYFYPLEKLREMSGFDVVQLMNPFIFYDRFFPSRIFIDQVAKRNDKFFMLAAGDDSYFWRYGRRELKYGPFDDFLKYDTKAKKYFMENDDAFHFNNYVINKAEGIIPIMHEYEKSYEGHPKIRKAIPIPINTTKVKYTVNRPGEKLIIFHGLNRYGFKGTRHIEDAFRLLAQKYPNDLELIIDGKMSLDEYLSLMDRVNVVIDQTSSYSCGVNAIYALAMGKVVLGGAEPESLISLGVESTPVVNIEPNSASIVSNIEMLLEQKKNFEQLGFESRKFAEDVHGHIKVACQYVKAWGE
jgi:hypothetical protein